MTSLRRASPIVSGPTLVRFVPAAGVLAVWAALMPASGGFNPSDWYPAALVLLGLLTVSVIGAGRLLPQGRAIRVALLALAAFTALNLLSVTWSDAPGTAWDAANLLVLGLFGAWTVALAPWRTASADVLFGGFVLAATVVCGVTLLASLDVSDLTSRFTDGRYNQPLDYPNSTAGFGFLAAVPALVMASRPDLPIAVKALAQGALSLLVTVSLLPQSRGSVVATAATLLFLLVLVPFRWRLALHAAVAGIVLALAAGPILDVYDAATGSGRVSPALDDAASAIWISTAIGLVAGLLMALVERRISLGEGGRRAVTVAGWAAWGAGALAVLVLAVANGDRIADAARDEWRSLKNPGIAFGSQTGEGETPEDESSGRLASVDPLQRYDYWRVALGGFRERPLLGIGAGAFEHRYAEERRYEKLSKYPHNLVVRILGENGIVGLLLFGVFTGALLAAMLARWREAGVGERGVAAAGLGVYVYFLVHGSFDWLEAFPVLLGPALALPFAAAVTRRGPLAEAPAAPRTRTRPRPLAIAGGAAAVVALGACLLAPWLSVRWTERAVGIWRGQPEAAYRDLDRAADVNPVAVTPLLYAGVIAIERKEFDRAQRFLERALGREEHWMVHYELAAIAAERGDRRAATRQLRLARLKNNRERVISAVLQEISTGKRMSAEELNGRLFEFSLFKSQRLS